MLHTGITEDHFHQFIYALINTCLQYIPDRCSIISAACSNSSSVMSGFGVGSEIMTFIHIYVHKIINSTEQPSYMFYAKF